MIGRLHAALAAAVLAVASFVAPAPALAQQGQAMPAGFSIPINQGTFNGTLRITGFAVQNNALVASGIVTGSVATATGITSVVRTVTLPVSATQTTAAAPAAVTAASCGVLHLELGPLDLDLLGLVVHLDKVVLDISAVPGAGNLLGNLLCQVVNLFNTGGALTQIASLLNQILAILGG